MTIFTKYSLIAKLKLIKGSMNSKMTELSYLKPFLLLLKEWKGRPLHPSLVRSHSTNRFLLKGKSAESQ